MRLIYAMMFLVMISPIMSIAGPKELIAAEYPPGATRDAIDAELLKIGLQGEEIQFCYRHIKALLAAESVDPPTALSVTQAAVLTQQIAKCSDPNTLPKNYHTLLKEKAVEIIP